MKAHALIVAQSAYEHWANLDDVAAIAAKMAAALKQSNYDTDASLINGANAADARPLLADWIRNLPKETCAIAIWTGHGHHDGVNHYLVCHDTPKKKIDNENAVATASIASFVGKSDASSLLLILDTCHSGQGSIGLAKGLMDLLSVQAADKLFSYAILASAHSSEPAKEGVFLTAVHDALFRPDLSAADRGWSDYDQWITPEALRDACYDLMSANISHPQYFASTSKKHVFPNPRFCGALPAQNVEERAWRLSTSDAAIPLGLAARGVEMGEQGWFFTGRARLQAELITWLMGSHFGLHIVTGPAGSGKSAVIGRIVLLSDAEYRRQLIESGELAANQRLLPPIGIVDVAVHAKGKTLDECARALCRSLVIPVPQTDSFRPEELIEGLRKLERRPITIVFDALDEAAEGHGVAIANELIVPLSHIASVRVLVGTRRSLDGSIVPESEALHVRLRRAFGFEAVIHDLASEHDSEEDIREYVYRRLRSSQSLQAKSLEWFSDVAKRVASKANGVFLYARIVSRTIREQGDLDEAMPATALAAFSRDLEVRFAGNEQRVRDLLEALAWSEGQGLSRHVWPLVASACSPGHQKYEDSDIVWALGSAGWHIVEAGEGGQAVYRLAHQSLADYYQMGREAKHVQSRIVRALRGSLKGELWLDCDHYLWRYLADHAAKAGELEDLSSDPGFLSVADPVRLVQLLWAASRTEGWPAAEIYFRVADRLIGRSPIERMSLIHLTAIMENPSFAPTLAPPVSVEWRCRWARVARSTPHRIIGRHNKSIGAVAFGELDGNPAVASVDSDGLLRLWNARSGLPMGNALQVDRHFNTISPAEDQSVAIYSLRGGRSILACISGCRLNLWDLAAGEWLRKGDQLSEYSLVAVGTYCDRPACVALHHDREELKILDALDFSQLAPAITLKARVIEVVIADLPDRKVVIVLTANRRVQIFDAASGKSIGSSLKVGSRSRAIALSEHGIVAHVQYDHSIKLYSINTGASWLNSVSGHGDAIISVAFGVIDGRAVLISGSNDGTLRIWDYATLDRAEVVVDPDLSAQTITALAACSIAGQSIVASANADGARLWDGATGQLIRRIRAGLLSSIYRRMLQFSEFVKHRWTLRVLTAAVAIEEINNRFVLLESRTDNSIHAWDLESDRKIGSAMRGHRLHAHSLTAGTVSGRLVVFSVGEDETTRFWNPFAGREVLQLPCGWKNIQGLVFRRFANKSVVVFAGPDGKIRVHDAVSGSLVGDEITPAGAPFSAFAVGRLDDRPIAVLGDEKGYLWLWALDPTQFVSGPFEGHAERVSSIGVHELGGKLELLSAGYDCVVTQWEVRLDGLIPIRTIPLQEVPGFVAPDGQDAVAIGLERGIVFLEFGPDGGR